MRIIFRTLSLAALLLWAAALGAERWRDVRTQARVTPSPNGGWPMGAMALALGVRLAKPGVYILHPGGHAPGPLHTTRAAAYGQKVVLALIPSALVAIILIASSACRSSAGAVFSYKPGFSQTSAG